MSKERVRYYYDRFRDVLMQAAKDECLTDEEYTMILLSVVKEFCGAEEVSE